MSVFTSFEEDEGPPCISISSERAAAKQTTVKNEAGETRERVLRMMKGKVDLGGLGCIRKEKKDSCFGGEDLKSVITTSPPDLSFIEASACLISSRDSSPKAPSAFLSPGTAVVHFEGSWG